jgi:hypothetical protein
MNSYLKLSVVLAVATIVVVFVNAHFSPASGEWALLVVLPSAFVSLSEFFSPSTSPVPRNNGAETPR